MRKVRANPKEYFEEMYSTYPVGTTRTKEMLRYFFMLGYMRAGNDVVDLVGDWACSVAGCPAELRRPEDIYDGVEEDLMSFFSDQIGEPLSE